MERKASNGMRDLLSRQLANILNILMTGDLRRGVGRGAPTVNSAAPGVFVTEESVAMTTSEENNAAEYKRLEKYLERVAYGVHPATKFLAAMQDMNRVDASTRADFDSNEEDNSQRMLTELDGTPRLLRTVAFDSDNSHDDVKKMLAELDRQISSLTQVNINNDPKMMLADINQQARLSSQKLLEEDDENLEALRSRLKTMLPPLCDGLAQDLVFGNDNDMNATTYRNESNAHNERKVDISVVLDKRVIYYAVALELEDAGFGWDKVQGWTTYLYNSGLEEYAAQQEKYTMVERSINQLEAIIHNCLEEEKSYCQSEEKERLLCRLIVSNLATDANEEELRLFFYHHKFGIRDILFLDERDPIRRTRVALIDMFTRISAVRASYIVGSIFGLGLDINLAVKQANHGGV